MSIAENISRVEEQIAAACRRAGRPRDSVRLMAVSKTRSPEQVLEVCTQGLRFFGENKVQEYAAKQPALAAAGVFASEPAAAVHLIGHLQSNKVAHAVRLFDAVDSVDSLRLAEKLNEAAAHKSKPLPILIEVKLSPEPSKHGIAPDADEFELLLERLPHLSNLTVGGLMTVPPYSEDPEQARPFFRRLRELQNSLARRYPHLQLDELSMGMSHDSAIAIEEGATTVRIGTAIFGERIYP